MDNKRFLTVAIVYSIIFICLIAFFYPKNAGGGTCGMCNVGEYRWIERSCLGYKYIGMHGSSPFDKLLGREVLPCLDCTGQFTCYGIVYGDQRCYDRDEEPRIELLC